MGSQASWGSSLVKRNAFLMGLPKGVMKRGVLIIGVLKFGVLDVLGVDVLGVLPAGSTWSPPMEISSGDREREGEWNCDGGADMGGVISLGVIGLGVIGADIGGVPCLGVIGLGVIGAELTSLWSPMFIDACMQSALPLCNQLFLLALLTHPKTTLQNWPIYKPHMHAIIQRDKCSCESPPIPPSHVMWVCICWPIFGGQLVETASLKIHTKEACIFFDKNSRPLNLFHIIGCLVDFQDPSTHSNGVGYDLCWLDLD